MGGWLVEWMFVLWALSVVPIRRNRRKNFPPSVAGLFCTPYHLRLQMQFKKQIPLWRGALCVGWAAAAMLMSAGALHLRGGGVLLLLNRKCIRMCLIPSASLASTILSLLLLLLL